MKLQFRRAGAVVAAAGVGFLIWRAVHHYPSEVSRFSAVHTRERGDSRGAHLPDAAPLSAKAPIVTGDGPDFAKSAAVAEPIAAFDNWLRNYLSTSGGAQASLESAGLALAHARRGALRDLIETDPAQALRNQVPWFARKQLPVAIVAQLETILSGRGDLAVLCAMPLPEQAGGVRPVLRVATLEGRSYDAFVFGRRQDQPTRRQVSLHGIAIDDVAALADSPVRVLEPGEPPSPSKLAAAPACPASGKESLCESGAASNGVVTVESGDRVYRVCGPRHLALLEEQLWQEESPAPAAMARTGTGGRAVVVLLVDFSDRPGANTTVSNAIAVMHEVDLFYRANSFEQMSFDRIDVTPVLRMPKASTEYAPTRHDALLSDAWAAATALGYVATDYDFSVVTLTNIGFPWSGLGTIGGQGVTVQGFTFNRSTVQHELGHNLGLWHAGAWLTDDESVLGPGRRLEYGNPFDIMGSGPGHMNANFKLIVGWLREAHIRTVSTSSTTRLHVMDPGREVDPEHTYALRVPSTPPWYGLPSDYWIEFRQGITDNPLARSGVLVYWATNTPGTDHNHLLDMNPGGVYGFPDAPLAVGRTFADAARGVFITPIAKGGSGADAWLEVAVQLNPTNVTSPSVALSSSALAVNPGEPIQFTATASDPDGDGLAYFWDFGDETLPETGLNQPTALKSWPGAGEYLVRCTVSDMKGGQATASLLVRVGNPSTFHISGRVLAQGNPVPGVRLNNGLTGPEYRGTVTDSAGNFALTELTAGSCLLLMAQPQLGFVFDPLFANPVQVGPGSVDGLVIQAVAEETVLISGVAPSSSLVGATVTIQGANFTFSWHRIHTVKFGDLSASFTLHSADRITAVVPAGAVTGPVTVIGTHGSDVSFAPFTVIPTLPSFTLQPQSQTNGLTLSAYFKTAILGSGPLSYQWRKDGAPILSATNTNHVIFNLQAEHAGRYELIASNPLGSTTSAVAVLTLVHVPTFEEMLDTTDLTWITGGDRLWLTQSNFTHDGVDAAQSGSPLSLGQTSWLQTTVGFAEPSVVRFWSKCSAGRYFYLASGDGTQFTNIWTTSGPYDWKVTSVLLPPGERTLRWQTAQAFAFSGAPTSWLDQITFATGAPPSIVVEPADQTVPEYRSVTFSVEAVGTPPFRYQWYRWTGYWGQDTQPITGATNAQHFVPGASWAGASSQYQVVVANDFGSITSRMARLTVVPPPSASIFSPVDDALVREGILQVRVAASGTFPVRRVELLADGIPFAETNAPAADGAYTFTVCVEAGGHFGLQARATDSEGAVGTSWTLDVRVMLSLAPLGAEWKYLDTGANLGSIWRTPFFNDGAWPSGPAQLGFGEGDEATVLASNRQVTTYFRHRFVVNDPDSVTQLVLRLRRDDGAVVYLNGAELLRDNMTNGAVNSGTLALLAEDDGADLHEFSLPPSLLAAGTNLLAVELHQHSVTSSDLSFDLGLDAAWIANRSRGVWLTAPVDDGWEPWFTVLGRVPIEAEAVAGAPLGLTKVEFRSDGATLGEDTARPWTFTWRNAPAGRHEITAVAFDTAGNSITSAPSYVTIYAPAATALVSFGEEWKYLDTGVDPGADGWRFGDFDDSAWASGPARLGYGGDGEATTIRFGPDPNAKHPTAWFRKKFHVNRASTFRAGLRLRVIRDDGVVVYLNGDELLRDNLVDGEVNASALANMVIGGADETTPIEVVIRDFYLLEGDNQLAVEVHQANATSSDLGFDLALSGLEPTALTPGVQFISPARDEQFVGAVPFWASVVATVPVERVDFFADGLKLGERAVAPYQFTWTNPPQGDHALTALARLADGSVLESGPVEILTLAPRFAGLPLVAANATWRYLDTGANLGTAWRAPAFSDSTWPTGTAPLGFGDDGMATTLRSANAGGLRIITYYFRHAFVVPADLVVTNLQVRLQRDDAAVIYLNGSEGFRDTNMPVGALTFTTRALSALGGDDESAWVTATLDPATLRAGTNVLAVELHQASTNSSDIRLALELCAGGYRSFPPQPPMSPQLSCRFGGDGLLHLAFPELNGRAFIIDASSDLRSWTPLATNSVTGGRFGLSIETAANPWQFFRARWRP